MRDLVFRDPAVKNEESWRVRFGGRVVPGDFNSEGAAQAHLDLLQSGYYSRSKKVKQYRVSVNQIGMTWLVCGVDNTICSPVVAQFFTLTTTIDEVKEWIRKNPKLILVEGKKK